MLSSQTVDNAADAPIVRPNYEGLTPSTKVLAMANQLGLQRHPEGGYFKETDRSPLIMENPYYPGHNKGLPGESLRSTGNAENEPVLQTEQGQLSPTRNYSTLIYYLLTCDAPLGRFHVNRSRIIHILQSGRGQYVLIYPDGRVKSFAVGFNYAKGEVSQWVVPGGVYKASFVAPLDGECSDDHLLISEVVVPGFEFEDHQFMRKNQLANLVGSRTDLDWLLGKQ